MKRFPQKKKKKWEINFLKGIFSQNFVRCLLSLTFITFREKKNCLLFPIVVANLPLKILLYYIIFFLFFFSPHFPALLMTDRFVKLKRKKIILCAFWKFNIISALLNSWEKNIYIYINENLKKKIEFQFCQKKINYNKMASPLFFSIFYFSSWKKLSEVY